MVGTFFYFFFLLILLPLIGLLEQYLIKYNSTVINELKSNKTEYFSEVLNYSTNVFGKKTDLTFSFLSFEYWVMLFKRIKFFSKN
jgi:hypothetical protein